jgi:tetratricopeptide (TPR) repeat protein/predicted Ser/Thr protein kinase
MIRSMNDSRTPDLVRRRRFGRYEILEKLGSGGMGVVYRARDLTLRRAVAIKVLRASASSNPERLARFEKEARAASALNHPNIVTIYDVGAVDDIPYIAMELVEGRTLRETLQGAPLLTRRALQLAAQAADGLAQAHSVGIVHRDLKPENIMVARDGRVKIVDFGLAKLIPPEAIEEASTQTQDSSGTEPGRVLGTAAYMSPEQAMGHRVDLRSDQFSCGAILYEMATGRPAFRRASRAQTLTAVIEEDPVPIPTLNPAVPAPLHWIVDRCLAKDPADRYGSTRDLARDLGNVLVHLAEVSPGARSVAVERRRRGLDKVPLRRLLAAVVVALAGFGGAFYWARLNGSASVDARPIALPNPRAPFRRSVAVLGFKNLSGTSESAWLSTALAEMLTTELAAGSRLRTIPGENVGRMKMELKLSDAESLAGDTLAKVGRNLGTDMVLLGSYLTLPEHQIRVDMRLQDVAAGETVAALAENGTESGLIDLVTRAGSRLRQTMGVDQPPATEVAALAAGAPSNLEAQRFYAEGLARLRVLDAAAARDLLVKAIAADPKSPMAHVALADAWTMLGYDGKAKEAAQRAFDLSSSLSREDRLSVEGRYREISGEWDKAIEIYRGLLAVFPDDIEYGLRLAGAQGTAGKGQEGLLTLARLRSLSAPASDDPRIDLTEAAIAHSLGDFRLEQRAASKAAAKGTAQGAKLLVARARLREAYALDRLGEVPSATVAAEQARTIYTEADHQEGIARALTALGSMSWNQGELESARATWEQALQIRRQIGYRAGVGGSLHNLAVVLSSQGDLDGARRSLDEAQGLDRELGNPWMTVKDLETLAAVSYEAGDLPRAKRIIEEALDQSRRIGSKTDSAVLTGRLAMVLHAEGDLAAAEAKYKEILPLLRESGPREDLAEVLFSLGELQVAKDDLAAARKSHEEALAARNAMRAAFAIAKSSVALANLAIEEGRADVAESLLPASTALFAAQKAPDWEASAQATLARSLLALGRRADASRAAERSTTLAGRSQSPHVRLAVAATAARVQAANGRTLEASRSLERALAEAKKLHLVGLDLEIRLAQAEVQMAAGRAAATTRELAALAMEARARGFALVARKAEVLQRARRPDGGGPS